MKGNRVWNLFGLWVFWVFSTFVGWMSAWAMTIAVGFSGFDSSSPPFTVTLDGLLVTLCGGAMVGFFMGVIIGLGQWFRSRNLRNLLLSLLMVVVVTAFLCPIIYIITVLLHRTEIFLLAGLAGGIMGGWVAGSLQWLFLQATTKGTGIWILISPVSWAIVFALLVGGMTSDFWKVPLSFLGGLVAGLLQWMVLRRGLKRAVWWIPATSVGWGLGSVLPLPGGVFIGVITATTLVFLLSLQPESF